MTSRRAYKAEFGECVVLTEHGAWLQQRDNWDQIRVCWIGKISDVSLRAFCQERGLRFVDARRF
jgi:hypothetical protein